MDKKVRKRVRLSTASCPACSEVGRLKRILFGMPGEDFDFDRYIIGGCIVSEVDAEIGCVNSGWEGTRGECSE